MAMPLCECEHRDGIAVNLVVPNEKHGVGIARSLSMLPRYVCTSWHPSGTNGPTLYGWAPVVTNFVVWLSRWLSDSLHKAVEYCCPRRWQLCFSLLVCHILTVAKQAQRQSIWRTYVWLFFTLHVTFLFSFYKILAKRTAQPMNFLRYIKIISASNKPQRHGCRKN